VAVSSLPGVTQCSRVAVGSRQRKKRRENRKGAKDAKEEYEKRIAKSEDRGPIVASSSWQASALAEHRTGSLAGPASKAIENHLILG